MNAVPIFDELIHQPTRFRICAALDSSVEMEFALLREVVDVSDSLLSKQLKTLADAGYLASRKQGQPVGRPRTWVGLTEAGRVAYLGHLAALNAIVRGPQPAVASPEDPAPLAGALHVATPTVDDISGPGADPGRGHVAEGRPQEISALRGAS